jgi:hypothetical protein
MEQLTKYTITMQLDGTVLETTQSGPGDGCEPELTVINRLEGSHILRIQCSATSERHAISISEQERERFLSDRALTSMNPALSFE